MELDLHALEALVALADHGSLRSARAAHGAEVEQQLRALEGELGLVLVEPVGSDAVLSVAGEDLLPGTLAVLAARDRLRVTARSLLPEAAGVLRLALAPGAAALVRDLLTELRERRPDVQVRLERPARGLEPDRILAGELDAALVRDRPARAALDAVEVARAPWVAVLGRAHPLAAPDGPVDLAALAPHPFVAVRRGRPVALHAELDEALGGRLAHGPVVGSVAEALELVAASDAWTVLTEAAATAGAEDWATVHRPLVPQAALSPARVWLVVRRGDPAPAVAELVEVARATSRADPRP